MRFATLMLGVCLCVPSLASAANWIGVCNDGKNVEYTLGNTAIGKLQLRTGEGSFVVTKMRITDHTADTICGMSLGDRTNDFVCMDSKRKIIFVRPNKPKAGGLDESSTYCTAVITKN